MVDQWVIPEGWDKAHPDELSVDSENPNRMKKSQKDALLLSLQTDGWLKPIVTNLDGLIADGEQKWDLAREHDQRMVPILRVDIDDAERRILRQVLNRLEGKDDELILALNYKKVDISGRRQELIQRLVLSESALRKALEDPQKKEETYRIPSIDQVETDIELGDIFALDKHSLQCGDSTKINYFKELMKTEKAHLIFTDPPYGVEYEGGTLKRSPIEGDESPEVYKVFLAIVRDHIFPKTPIYLCYAGTKSADTQLALESTGWTIRSQIIWAKNQAQYGALGAQYKFKHEPMWYAHRKGEAPFWYGPKNETTLWEIDRPQQSKLHPTMKPVELCARAITNSTMPGMTVLDPFGGSGSTLIACEQTKRICYMMEIDPRYCQIIIDRWEAYTGKKANKIEGSN